MKTALCILFLTAVGAQSAEEKLPIRNVHRDFAAVVKTMQSLQEEFGKSDRKQDKPRAAALKVALQRVRAGRLQESLDAIAAEKPKPDDRKAASARLLEAEEDLSRLLRVLLLDPAEAEGSDFFRAVDRTRVEAAAIVKQQTELLRAAEAKGADAGKLLEQQNPLLARLGKLLADLPQKQPEFVRSDPLIYEAMRGSPGLALADNRKGRAALEKGKQADAAKAFDSAADTLHDLVGLLEKLGQERNREQRPQRVVRVLSHLAAARNEQKTVNEELAALVKTIAGREGQKPTDADIGRRTALAARQDRQTVAVQVALAAFRGDASGEVYAEVARMVRRDSQNIHSRLGAGRLDNITLLISKDVEATLNDMIEAYSKTAGIQNSTARSLSEEFPTVVSELCRIIEALEGERSRLER